MKPIANVEMNKSTSG